MAYICAYVIEFLDGGPPEGKVLHKGTLEDCKKVQELLPAISYSGDRLIKSVYTTIIEEPTP